MRTYAVYGKNKWILTYMSIVGLACVALDIVRFSLVCSLLFHLLCDETHVPGMRCIGSSSLPMCVESSIFGLTTIADLVCMYPDSLFSGGHGDHFALTHLNDHQPQKCCPF